MARGAGFLATVIAIVAGVGSGINWLNHHLDARYIAGAGWVTLVALAAMWTLIALANRGGRYAIYAGSTALGGCLIMVLGVDAQLDYALGYAFAGCALAPPSIELFLRDKASRTRCPDCWEDIRAEARVCKHCGFRLAPKPANGAVANSSVDESSRGRSRRQRSAARRTRDKG